MNSTKRVLLVSASMVLLCLCIIVGATYALFTDGETVTNHLQAGDLNLRFERTYLEYTKLDADGHMNKYVVKDVVDFTETELSKTNLFGITDDRVIVPGSYVKADLKISNDKEDGGNVAFDYEAFILLKEGVNSHLANQLLVTVIDKNSNTVLVDEKPLNEMTTAQTGSENGYKIIGGEYSNGTNITVTSSSEFTVIISFVDDEVTPGIGDNDLAQNLSVGFDLVVNAVQSTSAPVNP